MSGNNDWLLIGKEEIRAYLKNASDYKLKKWIDAGMPVCIEAGEWTAHKANLEEFFKVYTRRRATAED
jgi:hypothetical protein